MTIVERQPVASANLTSKLKDSLPKSYSVNLEAMKDIAIPHQTGKDLSTYSKFLAIYTRNKLTDELYCMEQKQDIELAPQWKDFVKLRKELDPKPAKLSPDVTEFIVPSVNADQFDHNMGLDLKISEYQAPGETQIRGCVTTIENENDFNDWFVFHVLSQARVESNEKPVVAEGMNYHEPVIQYFEENLKNETYNDQWRVTGRAYFAERLRYFTDRYIRIECILPGFPCKSSNTNKVHSCIPDKGEELALKRLIQATIDIQKLYPPGMKVWIVSDGHVFSDCIGTDDDIVSNYTAKLHRLYEKNANENVDAIGFVGLNELLFTGPTADKFDPDWVKDAELPHYTGTKIDAFSEVSRGILMKGCDTDDGRLKEQLKIEGHPRLNLYRGFSRFMTEDLILLPYFQSMSRKAFKKTISKIAFTMIKRNDAYSNLVELVFPHHMRLSIHAHVNSGPKFGIKIIAPHMCKIVKSLEEIEEPHYEDLLHIPTPWHNSVVKVNDKNGNTQQLLMKTGAVYDALDKGIYKGEWIESCFETGEGGHFVLEKC